MTHDQYAVVIVYSTSHALRIEKLLLRQKIKCKMIPVPRQISSDCGVCVRILHSDSERVSQIIQEVDVEIQRIVKVGE